VTARKLIEKTGTRPRDEVLKLIAMIEQFERDVTSDAETLNALRRELRQLKHASPRQTRKHAPRIARKTMPNPTT